MSRTQFEPAETYTAYEAYEVYETHETYERPAPYDLHSAPTLPYGDTYPSAPPPVHEPTAPALPRQSDGRAER
ncbi:resuscitation-promoting factor, partial [Streptomyces rubrogriseus]|nr:resuscitation-promoting factor [Streptomyces rubrogriseus]